MTRKLPANSKKAWTPDTPLKVDLTEVLQKHGPANSVSEGLARPDNPLFSRGGNPKHPGNIASHKQFNRQKKG